MAPFTFQTEENRTVLLPGWVSDINSNPYVGAGSAQRWWDRPAAPGGPTIAGRSQLLQDIGL